MDSLDRLLAENPNLPLLLLVLFAVMCVVIGACIVFIGQKIDHENKGEALVLMGNTSLDTRRQNEILTAIESIHHEMEQKAIEFSNDTGFFPGWKANAAAKRAGMNIQRAGELGALLEIAKRVGDIKHQVELEHSRFLAEKVMQAQYTLQGRVSKLAFDLGMSVANYELYIQQKNTVGAEAERESLLSRIRIEEKREYEIIDTERKREELRLALEKQEREAQIRLDEKREQNKIDRERMEWENKLELAFGTQSTDFVIHDTIEELIARINNKYAEMHTIENGTHLSEGYRQAQIHLVQETINAYVGQKRELEARLHQTSDGQKSRGTRQTAAGNPEDPR